MTKLKTSQKAFFTALNGICTEQMRGTEGKLSFFFHEKYNAQTHT